MAIMVGRELLCTLPITTVAFFLYLLSNNLYALTELDVILTFDVL